MRSSPSSASAATGKAFAEFQNAFEGATVDRPSLRVAIAHADAPDREHALRSMVRDVRPSAQIEAAGMLGPVVGTHAGPGPWGCSGSTILSSSRTPPRLTTVTRLPTGFAAPDRPAQWTRPRASCRPDALARPLDTLRGVGPTAARRLAKLGLATIDDLLGHAPRRYETAAPERRIADLLAEEEVAIAGVVRDVTVRRPRRRLAIVRARVHDDSREVAAIWFNQEWLATKLAPGTPIRLRGRLQRGDFQVRAYDLGDALATADFAPSIRRAKR